MCWIGVIGCASKRKRSKADCIADGFQWRSRTANGHSGIQRLPQSSTGREPDNLTVLPCQTHSEPRAWTPQGARLAQERAESEHYNYNCTLEWRRRGTCRICLTTHPCARSVCMEAMSVQRHVHIYQITIFQWAAVGNAMTNHLSQPGSSCETVPMLGDWKRKWRLRPTLR